MPILRFIEAAMREAQNSDMNIKHGAVLVKNGKIVSTGHNHTRTAISGVTRWKGMPECTAMCSVHAEMHALMRGAPKTLKLCSSFEESTFPLRSSSEESHVVRRTCGSRRVIDAEQAL